MTTPQQNKQTVNFELPPISQDDISQIPQLHCRQKATNMDRTKISMKVFISNEHKEQSTAKDNIEDIQHWTSCVTLSTAQLHWDINVIE